MFSIVISAQTSLKQQTKLLGLTLQDRWQVAAKKCGARLTQNIEPGIYVLMLNPVILSQSGWELLQHQAQILPPESFQVLVPDALILVRSKTPNADFSILKEIPINPNANCFFALQNSDQLPQAEKWLLNTLIKDTEGFMSRHFERKISLNVTRLLINTSITPNQMSLISIGIGILGAALFTQSQKWYHVTGALLFWLHSVLDGCDGEIARLKFMHSRFGALLDFWGDNIVHSCIFAGIAFSAVAQSSLAPLLGTLAIGGTMGSASLAYFNTMRRTPGGSFKSVVGNAQQGAFQAVLDALARRDFIYLVIFLAAIDKSFLFLCLSAFGSPIYFLVLLFLTFKGQKS